MGNFKLTPNGVQFNGECFANFISEDTLKNSKYSIYAYAHMTDNEELVIKVGEAKKQTIYERYANITGHTATNHMVAIWEFNKSDKVIHNKLRKLSKNREYSVADKAKVNTEEAYLINSLVGYKQLIDDITEVVETKIVTRKEFRTDYPSIIRLVDEILKYNKEKYNLDLCARWGKTSTTLRLCKEYNVKENIQLFVMGSYVATVKTSYSSEILNYVNNDKCLFIDPDNYSEADIVSDINNWLSDPTHYVMYYTALTGDEKGCFERRVRPLYEINKVKSAMFIEEGDFGAHCDKQAKKIMNLYEKLGSSHILSMTGTNADRCEKIFTPDITIKRDYILDVLSERPNAVGINWTVFKNENMVDILGYSGSEMENFSDMLKLDETGHLRGEAWFESFFRFIFNREIDKVTKETRKYTKHTLLNEGNTIIFTSRGNEGHKALRKVLEKVVDRGYIIRVLDGDETSNEDCEQGAKEAIKTYGNRIIFIASDMANRSFSIPSIKNVILLMDGASDASIIQKVSRGLTPWGEQDDMCNVLDVRLQYGGNNLESYLSSLAVSTLEDNAIHTIDEILNILTGTDKIDLEGVDRITFNEYGCAGMNPFRKLTREEISNMLRSSTYQKCKAIKCYYDFLDNVPETDKMCLNEKNVKLGFLSSSSYKGKGIKTKTNSSAKTTKEKEDLSKDGRFQHLSLLINHFDIFVTGRYKNDLLRNEFENMSKVDEKFFEDTFNMDMKVMRKIVEILLNNNVNLDKEVSLL